MKDYTTEMIIAGIVVLILGLFICDAATSKRTTPVQGKVSARLYDPPQTTVNTYVDSNGHTQVTTHYEPAHYKLIILLAGNRIHTAEFDVQEWTKWKEGDEVIATWSHGGLIGIDFNTMLTAVNAER